MERDQLFTNYRATYASSTFSSTIAQLSTMSVSYTRSKPNSFLIALNNYKEFQATTNELEFSVNKLAVEMMRKMCKVFCLHSEAGRKMYNIVRVSELMMALSFNYIFQFLLV